MKQNIKRIWLALSMAVSLFVLVGCGAKTDHSAEELDPSILMTMQQGSQQYLELFNEMNSEETIEETIATSAKNKDTVMETALKSWQGIYKDLGAFVSSETAEVEEGEEGYIARIHAVYENRNMEFTLMVDEDLAYLTSISFNPEYTFVEKMAKAGMNTLMGMGTVFAVLIFISGLIACFKYINRWEENAKKRVAFNTAPVAPAPAPSPAPVQAAPAPAAVEEAVDVSDDTELVAVIAAAIAASEGKASADGLVVRSIKRVPNGNWKRA